MLVAVDKQIVSACPLYCINSSDKVRFGWIALFSKSWNKSEVFHT